MLRIISLSLFLLLTSCVIPSGAPGPDAVLVVSSRDYSAMQILEALDTLKPTLGKRINKKSDFPYFDVAYWYPYKGSSHNGVAVAKWPDDLSGDDVEEMKHRYFVEVYTEKDTCLLCKTVKETLASHKISFFSACDHFWESNSYERLRCDT